MTRTIVRWLSQALLRLRGIELVQDKQIIDEPSVVTLTEPESPKLDELSEAEVESRKAKRRVAKARDKIADTTSDILERFEKLDQLSLERGSHTVDAQRSLEMLLGCDFHLVADITDDELGVEDRAFFTPDGNVADLAAMNWPIDIGLISRKESGYSLNRVFTAKPEEIRGQTNIYTTKSVFYISGSLNDDGSWWAETRIAGLVNGRWVPIDQVKTVVKGGKVRTQSKTKHSLDELHLATSMMFSFALTERYEWHAAFGAEEGPRLLLPTSSGGASALFKNRDADVGKKRRAALRHWVQNHYRSKDSDMSYVRDHLRGATKFDWLGLNCELLVSAFDLEKNEFFKAQASEWRSMRKHNRVKVRLKRAV